MDRHKGLNIFPLCLLSLTGTHEPMTFGSLHKDSGFGRKGLGVESLERKWGLPPSEPWDTHLVSLPFS